MMNKLKKIVNNKMFGFKNENKIVKTEVKYQKIYSKEVPEYVEKELSKNMFYIGKTYFYHTEHWCFINDDSIFIVFNCSYDRHMIDLNLRYFHFKLFDNNDEHRYEHRSEHYYYLIIRNVLYNNIVDCLTFNKNKINGIMAKFLYDYMTPIRNELAQHPLRLTAFEL